MSNKVAKWFAVVNVLVIVLTMVLVVVFVVGLDNYYKTQYDNLSNSFNKHVERYRESFEIEIQELRDEIERLEQELEDEKLLNTLVRATFRHETGNGTSRLWLENNNAGGIKCGSGWCKYTDPSTGIHSLKTLLRSYRNRYGDDLRAIREVYCQGGCDFADFMIIYEEEQA